MDRHEALRGLDQHRNSSLLGYILASSRALDNDAAQFREIRDVSLPRMQQLR